MYTETNPIIHLHVRWRQLIRLMLLLSLSLCATVQPTHAAQTTTCIIGSIRQTHASFALALSDTNCATIQFDGTSTVTGSWTITRDLTIEGYSPFGTPDTIFDGNNANRIFTIGADNIDVTFDTLLIRNGDATAASLSKDGGAIYNPNANATVTVRRSDLINNRGDFGGAVYSEGPLTIANVEFSGNRATTSGGTVAGVSTVAINNVTFANNQATNGTGGAVYSVGPLTVTRGTFTNNRAASFGGAIYALDTTLINNATFTNNQTTGGPGGAVSATTALTVNNSTFSGNQANGDGSIGGAIYVGNGDTNTTLTIAATEFDDNVADFMGGALFQENGVATIEQSTFTNNATRIGGGLLALYGQATVRDSTFAYNTASIESAAIQARDGQIEVINSTISDNSSPNGAVTVLGYDPGNTSAITLTHTTVADNGVHGTTFVDLTGGNSTMVLTLQNSIVAGHTSADCVTSVVATLDATPGYNLDSDGTCVAGGGAGNLTSASVGLNALADNGGTTQTRLLAPTNPARDQIPQGTNGCGTTYTADQRGVTRPQNGLCDIGAVEIENQGAPTITSAATATAEEHQTLAIDVDATDEYDVEGGGLTFRLSGGVDVGLFTINADTGVVSFTTAPDYENPTDSNGDNNYNIQVTVSDSGALSDVQEIVITVTDITENLAPTITNSAAISVVENQTAVVDVNATDDYDTEGNGLTFRLSGSVDDTLFAIDSDTGIVTFRTAPDYENPADSGGDNSYNIEVTVTDAGSPFDVTPLTAIQAMTITVTDIPECGVFPLDVSTANELSSAITCYNYLPAGSYAINITQDLTLNAAITAIDNSDAVLQINGNGHVLDGNDSYRIFAVTTSDVTFTDMTLQQGRATNGGALLVESQAVVTLTQVSILHNTATSVGGAIYNDGTLTINNSSITANTADYGGGLRNNGTLTISQSTVADNVGTVSVGGIYNAGTMLTISRSTISGNAANQDQAGGLFVETGTAIIDNSTFSANTASQGRGGALYNIGGNVSIDNSTFADNAAQATGGIYNYASGTLTVRNSIITAGTSGGNCAGDTGGIDATNLADDSTCGSAAQSATINLGPLQDNGGPTTGAGEATFTHALLSGSAAIDAGDNSICAAAPINNIDQRGLRRPQGITCDIGAFEVANPPTITSNATATVAENQTAAIDVNAADSNDAEGSGLTFAFSGGVDDALFAIDADTGVATFSAAPDYEIPADTGGDNTYNIQVTVTDADGFSATQDIAITVTDIDENTAPTITSSATATVAENQTAAIDVNAVDDSDSEGSGLTFSLSGGVDDALFAINADTGVVTFNSAPDYENPADTGGDNTYNIQVTVTDSGDLSDVQDIAVTVTDVAENSAPTITSSATASVAENQTAAIDVNATDDSDAEGSGLTYSLSGGVDDALFAIEAATGIVTFLSAPDYDNPGDTGSDNTYNIQVTVTDSGGLTASQAIAIVVVDECPALLAVADVAALSHAIDCYNVAAGGAYTIDISQDIRLTAATTPIANPVGVALIINGNGHTINGANSYRHFTLTAGDVTVTDITLTNGLAPEDCQFNGFTSCGGAISIDSAAIFTLTQVSLLNNRAPMGGALYIHGATGTVNTSTIADNISSGQGGGIVNNGGMLTIANSAITNNKANNFYAGVYHVDGTLVVNNSTIANNTASGLAGITIAGGVATIGNSTISGNRATSGSAGALYHTGGTLTLNNSTIAANEGTWGGSGLVVETEQGSGDSLTVRNTIIAENTGGSDCTGAAKGDIDATNLASDDTCGNAVQSNQINLGPLQDNGGTATSSGQAPWTHALLPTSAAVNAGDNTICAAAPINGLDQRGVNRPQYATCDIGAFEFEQVNNPIIVSTSMITLSENQIAVVDLYAYDDSDAEGAGLTFSLSGGVDDALFAIDADTGVVTFRTAPDYEDPADNGGDNMYNIQVTVTDSAGLTDMQEIVVTVTDIAECDASTLAVSTLDELNMAIACYNDAFSGSYTINLMKDITLAAATTTIHNGNGVVLQINGNAHTIDGAASYRHFTITDGAVTIADIALQNGQAPDDCQFATFSCGGAILIENADAFTLTHATLINNSGADGSGLYSYGTVATVNNSMIADNRGSYHGAGIINRNGTLTINTSTISGNSGGYIGGVANEENGTLTVSNSTIANNSAQYVGGIQNQSGLMTISNSTLSGNAATDGAGGGVSSSGTTIIYNSTIAVNSAGTNGGGIAQNGGSLTLRNTIVADNTSGGDCSGVEGSDVDGTNLAGDGTCGGAIQSEQTNLGPLQDNGGTTWTHAILPNSAAFNAGDNAICAAVPVNNLDQRGVSRPQYATCDIGAYEFEETDAPVFTSDAGLTIWENQTEVIDVNAFDTNDSEGNGLLYSFSGADIELFNYDTSTGVVTFINAPDFENPADSNGDNVYNLQVTVTDSSGLTAVQEIVITVLDYPECGAFPLDVGTAAELNLAIACYNFLPAGSYTINLIGDITLVTDTTTIANSADVSLHINGNSHTIDGADSYRIFTISNRDVTIADITLQNGNGGDSCINTGCGGAVHVASSAVVTLTNASVLDSTSSGYGGGLYNQGTTTIHNSTFADNTAFFGGGLANEGTLTVSNSTISANTAEYGGGLGNLNLLTSINNTITGNGATQEIGGLANYGTAITVHNTIIANSTSGDNCGGDASGIDATNLSDDATCGSAIQSAAINLGPLQNNGGPTPTHALLDGSAAIDAGDSTICAADPVNNLDQRGFTRLQGTACDIGAYEVQVATPAVPGDVDCSDTVTIADALMILQYDVDLRTDSGDCPLGDSANELNAANGDVNGDDATNLNDALLILQCDVGVPNAFCPIVVATAETAGVGAEDVAEPQDQSYQLFLPLVNR